MFKISKDIDYSFVFLSFLLKQKKLVSLSLTSKETEIPLRFLAKIASILAKNNLIRSKEGKQGGYLIKKKALNISLYDYFKIFKKDLNILPCNHNTCNCKRSCQHKKIFQERIENKFFEILKKIKVQEIL